MQTFVQPELIMPNKKSTETPQPHAKILFCMVGTKQSLKDAGGGVHDAVISTLQEATIKKGSLDMYKARIQMLKGF